MILTLFPDECVTSPAHTTRLGHCCILSCSTCRRGCRNVGPVESAPCMQHETTLQELQEKVRTASQEDERSALVQQCNVCSETMRQLENDSEMLNEFISSSAVTDASGKRHAALQELSGVDATSRDIVERGVVRLKDGATETIFACVHPGELHTALIFRLRSGWPSIKAALLLPRWEVYVCTASEEPYAKKVCPLWHACEPASA